MPDVSLKNKDILIEMDKARKWEIWQGLWRLLPESQRLSQTVALRITPRKKQEQISFYIYAIQADDLSHPANQNDLMNVAPNGNRAMLNMHPVGKKARASVAGPVAVYSWLLGYSLCDCSSMGAMAFLHCDFCQWGHQRNAAAKLTDDSRIVQLWQERLRDNSIQWARTLGRRNSERVIAQYESRMATLRI
jgi:hypothetical protein